MRVPACVPVLALGAALVVEGASAMMDEKEKNIGTGQEDDTAIDGDDDLEIKSNLQKYVELTLLHLSEY